MFLLPLFHLLRSFGDGLFLKALEALLRWKAAPSLCLPLFSLRSCFLFTALRNGKEENIPPMQEHSLCLTPAAGPLWTFFTSHTSPQCTGTYFYCFSLSPYKDSSSLLFLSTPLFTHLPPITSHQTALENSLVYITCFEVVQITVM